LTIGWLKSMEAKGSVPAPPNDGTARERTNATLVLTIGQSHDRATACRTVRAPVTLILRTGNAIEITDGAVTVQSVDERGTRSAPRTFDPALGRTLTAFDGIKVRLATAKAGARLRSCSVVPAPGASG
jgi:hypothetical protein